MVGMGGTVVGLGGTVVGLGGTVVGLGGTVVGLGGGPLTIGGGPPPAVGNGLAFLSGGTGVLGEREGERGATVGGFCRGGTAKGALGGATDGRLDLLPATFTVL